MIKFFANLNKGVFLFGGFLLFTIFLAFANNLETGNMDWDYDGVLYHFVYEHISLGHVPFRDFFVEYPPLAAYVLALPALLANLISTTFTFGTVGFNNSVLVFVSLLLGLFHFVTYQNSPLKNRKTNFLLWCCVYGSALVSHQVFFGRFDYLPALMSSFGILAYLKYLQIQKHKFFILSVVLICLGVFVKIYPLLFLILIVLFEILLKRYKNLVWVSLIFAIGVGINLYFYSIGSENFAKFLQYQTANRDLEVGSIMAGFTFVLDWLKLIPKEQIVFQNAATELGGVTAKLLAKFSLPLICGSVVYSVWYLFQNLKSKIKTLKIAQLQEVFVLSSLVLVGLFLIFNKVFSPQYLTWLYLLLPLLSFVNFAKYKDYLIWLLISPVVISYLTFTVFPYHWKSLMLGKLDVIYLLNLRNLVLIVLVLSFFSLLKAKLNFPRHSEQSEESVESTVTHFHV
jgi:hypothetical protein